MKFCDIPIFKSKSLCQSRFETTVGCKSSGNVVPFMISLYKSLVVWILKSTTIVDQHIDKPHVSGKLSCDQ